MQPTHVTQLCMDCVAAGGEGAADAQRMRWRGTRCVLDFELRCAMQLLGPLCLPHSALACHAAAAAAAASTTTRSPLTGSTCNPGPHCRLHLPDVPTTLTAWRGLKRGRDEVQQPAGAGRGSFHRTSVATGGMVDEVVMLDMAPWAAGVPAVAPGLLGLCPRATTAAADALRRLGAVQEHDAEHMYAMRAQCGRRGVCGWC